MAMTQITTPAAGASDWSDFVDQVEKHRRGYIQVTFDSMADGATAPKIAQGSVVVVAGAVYHCDADTSISGSASSGNTNYVRMVSGTPTWTTVAPTWSDAQQGWYDGTVAYRYIGGCYYDGSTYDDRFTYNLGQGYERIEGNNIYAGNNTFTGNNTFSGGADLGGNGTRIKCKTFTGNLDGNADATIAHGLSVDDIISYSVMAYETGVGYWYCMQSSFGHFLNGTNLYINSSDALFNNEAYRVIIWYKD